METLQDELTKKVRAKIIELFGPESALAQAMEDDNFMDKLADLVAYIYGLVILSQPRPEPKSHPYLPTPNGTNWERSTAAPPNWTASSITASTFYGKLWSALSKG